MDLIKKCFGWLAAITNIFFYLTPLKPFINAIKGKLNFEDTPKVNVLICYINCLIWYIYGRMTSNIQIQTSYMTSGIFSLLLIFIYLIYESKKYFCDSILNTFFLIIGTWAVYRALILIINKYKITGYVSIGTTLLLFCFPIYILHKIKKEKNTNIITFFSFWRYLFASILWLIYSIFIKDIFLAIANSLGIIFSFIYIIIYYCYKRKHPVIFERRNSNNMGIIAGGNNDEIKKEEIPIKLDEEYKNQNDEKPVKIVNKLKI